MPGLSACAASAVSGCWWTSEAALALSDARGRVALAQLPGLEADLLLGPEGEGGAEEGGGAQRRGAQEHGVTFAPGKRRSLLQRDSSMKIAGSGRQEGCLGG